ncbi:TetR/AcrR family transcriptional regulator [Rhodococcus sp. IEGM 1401]|uniref:TetR/AcrR family transcriptional regulator n=1 Tax=unclassified Rhodococcus (in: high G+C Gram-positive bacteria) TaxID=192944 RepID=UPI0022B5C84E|nr:MULTISPECIES: TetR/AcrR family transcriptional regulator [unclassified Rhodococcus (in: high G+C Gram-positive bacteria)]MCZ4561081.1 TetR/AcrR family transcriptional regulator [Rhodococcus sp. IEGM 1401]MDI9921284.1 TetR/AcrR family transcriptional regulator [Rhodococcus sp. IEGM 1372]MDV8033737.1 TetR/AcrR family transcriptional regulator [Rhodococcus sp. IEGM 1414]
MTKKSMPEIPRIVEGVFFTTPPRLPRGPHGLARDEVVESHRERLMIAFTELIASRGYAAVGVKDIVDRSSVSRSAFYGCFDSKESCADAAYARFISVLVNKMTNSLVHRASEDVFAVLATYLTTLGSDLVVARAFQVEMDAASLPARERRRQALSGLAAVLHHEMQRQAAVDSELDSEITVDAMIGAIYAVRQFASDLLDTEAEPDLGTVTPRLARWLENSLRKPRGHSSA